MALTKVTTGGIKDGTITNEDISTTTSISQDKLAAKPGASSIASGLMTSADKIKLDGVADNANNYSHPSAHTIAEVTGLQGLLDGKTTETYVNTQITNVVGVAPAALDTLTELAAALGDDANYAATTTTALGNRYTKAEADAKIVELSPPATKAHIESLGIAASSITGTLPAIDGSALTGIDAVVVGTTLPSPVSTEGSLFYKSDTDIFYISNGTQWTLVSNASPATTGGTVTIGALNEGGTFSYNLGIDFEDDVDTDAELTYTLYSGTMPTGCTLPTTGNSAFTGTASGVSSNTNYTWTIKATDTSGGTATQDYQQQINTVVPTVTGGTVTIPAVNEYSSASYDVDNNFTFTTGSAFSAYSLASGTLPSGLSLNASTGVISGTMGAVASTTAYSFTIRATDTDGDTADQAYLWSINNLAPFTKANLSSMPHSGINVTEAGSPKITSYGVTALSELSVVAGSFGGHDGHEGSPADWPAYWAVYLGTAKAVNKLVVSLHGNSFGNFELQGSNNANTSGTFYNTGTWTSLTFTPTSSTYSIQNGGGQSSGLSDHTKITSMYVNNTAYTHYRVWFKDTYRPGGGGAQHDGWASYYLSLDRV